MAALNNKMKKLILKVSSIALAAMLCITSINSNVIFPVSAEGEDVTTDQTTAEETPTETPEETPEPGDEGKPAPVEPQPEETPIEELPATISMQRLMAAPKAVGNIVVDVKDTEGNVLEAGKQISDGWIKDQVDNGTIISELNLNDGNKYSFAGAFVDNTPCVYIAKIDDDVYYSSDGVSAAKLEGDKKIVLKYHQYFTIIVEEITNSNFGTVKLTDSKIAYEENASQTAQPKLTKTNRITAQGDTVRAYANEQLMCSVVTGYTTEGVKTYVGTLDASFETVSDFENGKTFYSIIAADGTLKVGFKTKDSITVKYNSQDTDPKEFETPYKTDTTEIKFDLKSSNSLTSAIIMIDGVDYQVKLPDNNKSTTTKVGPNDRYIINVSRTESGFLGTNKSYNFTITPNSKLGFVDDLSIITSKRKLDLMRVQASFNEDKLTIYKREQAAFSNYDAPEQIQNGGSTRICSSLVSGIGQVFGADWASKINYLCVPQIGYYVAAPTYDSSYLSLTNSDDMAGIEGATKSFEFSLNDYSTNTQMINFLASPVQGKAEFEGSTASDTFTIEDNTAISMAPAPHAAESGKVFVGWKLENDPADRVYSLSDQIVFDKTNWNLGTPSANGETTTFTFKPVYAEENEVYTIQHYKQMDNGEYLATPDVESKYYEETKGYSPGTTGEVVAIPNEYEGYTVDYSVQETIRSIHLTNGKPEEGNNVMRLYYKKNVEYASYTVSHNVDGPLADTTKEFEFKVTAEKSDTTKSFPEEYFQDSNNGWKKEHDKYTHTFKLKHGQTYSLQSVPATNCTYTFEQTTNDDFYTTTSKLNGGEETPIKVVTHTPVANGDHTVEFINTAKDVPATGNDINNYAYMELLSIAAAACLLFMIMTLVRRYYL